MTPALATRLAERAYPARGAALAFSLTAFALVAVAASVGSASAARIAGALAGPMIGLPWAILCAGIWFHPEHGAMALSARFMKKLPAAFQLLFRWYAAIFLTLFVLFCAVIWPAFAYSNLWLLAR
jgi:hypothetical protein